MFEARWEQFLNFISEQGLEAPKVRQCEVTYVNHIDRGAGWDSIADWHKVFRQTSPIAAMDLLPEPESRTVGLDFVMPDKRGRLRVSITHGFNFLTNAQTAIMQLTARGEPESSDAAHIGDWLDLGREWVVRGFADLTTPSMHSVWGVKK